MNVNFKNGILKIERKLKSNETYKISKTNTFESISIYKKPQILSGVSSYCKDGKHILFIDYDNVPRWLVEQDYKIIQEVFQLPIAYLFTTKEQQIDDELFGNYHVICLAKFFPSIIYKILSYTHADINYLSMPLRNKYRNWILRIGPKKGKDRPTFICYIGESIDSPLTISKAHWDLLQKLYPEVKHPIWLNTDNLNKIFLQGYEAS